jgi:hypothetical protein
MSLPLENFLLSTSIRDAIDQAAHVIPVGTLRAILTTIKDGFQRYWLDDPLVIMRERGNQISWIMLYCAYPAPGQMTDELSFAVPVLTETILPGREELALVFLDADTLWPSREGLYLEGGRVLGDFMEDWSIVWPPLQRALTDYESDQFARLHVGLQRVSRRAGEANDE